MKLNARAVTIGALAVAILICGVSLKANNFAAAQSIGAGAGCTITSDPAVSSGAATELLYEVVNRPTRITISATDSAANPTGTPTVGAPDPDRVDGNAVGTIMTGPITKDTTFTMTASNAKGASTCSVKVRFKAKPAAGWQVPLVSQNPVFNRLQIPGGFDNGLGYLPFMTAYWVSGGYFVVNGNGNSGAADSISAATPAIEISTLHGLPTQFESGGMYGFKEDGTFVGARDVDYDTSVRATRCFEAGGCYTFTMVSPVGQGKFIRDMSNNNRQHGFFRSPALYSVTASGFTMDHRLYYIDNTQGPVGSIEDFSDVAVAGGKMIGVAQRYVGTYPVGPQEQGVPRGPVPRFSLQNEIYDMNFTKIASFSTPWPSRQPGQNYSGTPPTTAPLFYPMIGVGDYIIGSANRPGYNGVGAPPVVVYKMPSSDELSQGVAPTEVQTILGGKILLGFSLDTTNSNRIAFLTIPNGTNVSNAVQMVTVFEAGASGLTQVSERSLSLHDSQIITVGATAFAFSGDYLAYGSCPGTGQNRWNGERGGLNFDGCELVVEKVSSGERLATEPLPRSKYSAFGIASGLGSLTGESQAIGAVAMSPTGRIMVTTGVGVNNSGGGENGNVYLYQIGGAPSSPPDFCTTHPLDPSCIPGNSTSTDQFPGQKFSVNSSTTLAGPEVWIQFAIINSKTASSLTISIFGRTYTVDLSASQIVNNSWAPTTLGEFAVNGFANVFGYLDTENASLIHSIRLRNPLPPDASPPAITSGDLKNLTIAPPTTVSASTQSQLNSLMQALQALQARLAQ